MMNQSPMNDDGENNATNAASMQDDMVDIYYDINTASKAIAFDSLVCSLILHFI